MGGPGGGGGGGEGGGGGGGGGGPGPGGGGGGAPPPRAREGGGGGEMKPRLMDPYSRGGGSRDGLKGGRARGGGSGSAEDEVSPAKRQDLQRKRHEAGSMQDRIDAHIAKLREGHLADPEDVYLALDLAESLRQRDLTIHDGGSAQMEAMETYGAVIDLLLERRGGMIAEGRPTSLPGGGGGAGAAASSSSSSSVMPAGLSSELFLPVRDRSTDGLLCAAYCGLAKVLFMASMFEKAVRAYDDALALDPAYLDALTHRSSTLIILGRYQQAAAGYRRVLELDVERIFVDAFTGMAKILVANEGAVEGGWTALVDVVEAELPSRQATFDDLEASAGTMGGQVANALPALADALKRMNLAMFSYHDSKTKDAEAAWEHLTNAFRAKMAVLPPFAAELERNRVKMVKQVFQRGFWPPDVGSESRVPIFIIGFVRSGSTLLERVLDAHSSIVGTGEDSVFNGRLETIRDRVVSASVSGDGEAIRSTVLELARGVVRDTRIRWETIEASDENELEAGGLKVARPERFVDKMLNNYMNVGFIHLLFPDALILHVAREPMDCVFSAYKHDFPPGTLDYTSEFESLAQLYHGYRDVMEHWDRVLPGRVTHVRYEDLVEDLPGVARSIIAATGLPWEEGVLEFHKKKQAVNTHSTTQVRKGMYKDHFKSWMRYEGQLQPLIDMLGTRVDHVFQTTISGYRKATGD